MILPGLSDESAVTKREILASWRDTPTTRAITDFVARATTEGEPLYLPPAERVAVFDNDRTPAITTAAGEAIRTAGSPSPVRQWLSRLLGPNVAGSE